MSMPRVSVWASAAGAALLAAVPRGLLAAEEGAAQAPVAIPAVWWLAPLGGVLAVFFAWVFYRQVMEADEGDPAMKEIAGHVREGAYAYLRQQYKIVAVFFVVVAILLAVMAFGFNVQHWLVPFAFLTGGFWSGLCGFLGMKTATNASHRTCAAARESLNKGLVVAFRAGAVMGLVVVGFGLIDITGWFLLLSTVFPKFGVHIDLMEITVIMLCFGMGASSQALFARLGGGIYTKAADVGADLVGKVEAGIPEDDARNPATIADNVGDNVGDVAGMGADLFESYCGSILATAALGIAAAASFAGSVTSPEFTSLGMKLLTAPMALAGIGTVLSVIGIYMVRTHEGATMRALLRALLTGVMGSSVLIAVAGAILCQYLFDGTCVSGWGVWGAIMSGLVAGIVIGQATEYYTSYEYSPTRGISEQARTGPATVIIAGVAEGMKSTWASIATVIVGIMAAFYFAGGGDEFNMGLYGVGIAAVGMLSTLGITLATDAYGPIADNAGGNAQMTSQKPEVRERTDALDSLGNTTAATGKGFAIGSAALTALALMAAYIEEVRIGQIREAAGSVAVQALPPAESSAVYLGKGKFGQRLREGTKDLSFGCLMALDGAPEWLAPGARVEGIGPEGPKEDGYVREAVVTDTKGRPHTLRLVAARRASMRQYMDFYGVNLMNPNVLCGIFSGVLLVFLFCALTMKAVGRAAYSMMLECRDQFAKIRAYLKGEGKLTEAQIADPDNWPKRVTYEGHVYPDYARCVAISTAGAQREMIVPTLLAVAIPVVVGYIFNVAGVMGLLAGGLASGFAVAVFMANAGGAWDNAKKWIETGQHGGKGSDAHKAAVVGDTVGDPFKDTSGPSLNILIKLMSMVSVVFAGLIVKFGL